MGMFCSSPPDGVLQALDRGLNSLSALREGGAEGSGADVRTASRALPVYVLGLADALAGALASANLTSWRYLVADEGGAAFGDVSVGLGGEATLARLTRTDKVHRLLAGLMVAERHSEDARTEVRLLEAPALHASALWLLRPQRNDLFVPLEAPPEATSSQEYLARLHRRASHASAALAALAPSALKPNPTSGGDA